MANWRSAASPAANVPSTYSARTSARLDARERAASSASARVATISFQRSAASTSSKPNASPKMATLRMGSAAQHRAGLPLLPDQSSSAGITTHARERKEPILYFANPAAQHAGTARANRSPRAAHAPH